MTIIPIAAELVEAICFIRKNDGTPRSAATEKQTSCLFVRLNITLLFTFVRSRGTDIYDAAITVFLSLMCMKDTLGYGSCLKERKHKKDRVSHNSPQ